MTNLHISTQTYAQSHSHRYSTHTYTSKYTATVCSYIHTYISTVCMIVCTLSVYLKPNPLCHSSHLPQELCSVLLLQLQEIPERGKGRAGWNATQHTTANNITVSHQHSTTQSCVPDHVQHHKRPGADGQGLSRLQVSCDIYASVFLRPLSEPGQCPVTLLMALAWCVGGAAVMTSPLWVGLQ